MLKATPLLITENWKDDKKPLKMEVSHTHQGPKKPVIKIEEIIIKEEIKEENGKIEEIEEKIIVTEIEETTEKIYEGALLRIQTESGATYECQVHTGKVIEVVNP